MRDLPNAGFLWLPSLAAPLYESDISAGWLLNDGFLSGHPDLEWPIKSIYLILPILLSFRPKFQPVIDTANEGEEVDINVDVGFFWGDFFLNLFLPAGIQMLFVSNKIFDTALDALGNKNTNRRLRMDFEKMWPKIQKLKIELGERQIKLKFDEIDADKDGVLSKSDARRFIDEVIKFKDQMTDELFEVIYWSMTPQNGEKISKTEAMNYCLQLKAGGESF